MFKTLSLGALYNLSDGQIEYQVRDRLCFMLFHSLGLEDWVPDAKPVLLYREGLAEAGAHHRSGPREGQDRHEEPRLQHATAGATAPSEPMPGLTRRAEVRPRKPKGGETRLHSPQWRCAGPAQPHHAGFLPSYRPQTAEDGENSRFP